MAYGCAITVNAAKITGTVSGLVWLFTEDNLPATAIDGGATSILNGGGNLRCYTDGTKVIQLPIHVVTFQTGGTPKVLVYGRSASLAVGGTVYIEADAVATVQPLPSNVYGSRSVYADYAFLTYDGLINEVDGASITNVGVVTGANLTPWGGDSLDFGGAVNNYLQHTITSLSEYRLQAWIRPTGLRSQLGDVILYRGAGAESALLLDASPNDVGMYNAPTGWLRSGVSSTSMIGAWHKLTSASDGSSRRVSIDGVVEATSSISTEPTRTALEIGSRTPYDSNTTFLGEMGAIAVSAVSGDSSQDEAEFNNQSSPSTFWSTSAWVDSGGGPTIYPWWLYGETE